jgi:hypothetical protein
MLEYEKIKNEFGLFIFIITSINVTDSSIVNHIETANSISVILTDYRKHRYYSVSPS